MHTVPYNIYPPAKKLYFSAKNNEKNTFLGG